MDVDGAAALDCLIIGGGAAGLTAAIYLARFRRHIRLVDAGSSRLLSIPTSHNYPGFTGGIRGADILQRLRAQADHYGASITGAVIEKLDCRTGNGFVAACSDREWQARNVILATGVVDVEPDFPDVKRAVAEGCVRYCPICDGFEAIGKKVAVIGRGKDGFREALFVKHFASEVSLFSLTGTLDLDATERAVLDGAGVRTVATPVDQLAFDDTGVMQVHLHDGKRESFDMVYAALGTLVNSGLARMLGADCTGNGELLVDAHQQTSITGLYAAGDIVTGLNQITVAMGQAAIAATAIHNQLA